MIPKCTIVFQKTWGKHTDTVAIRDDVTKWEHSSPLIYRPPK